MSFDADDTLLRALHRHNPWWEEGGAAFSLPANKKSDFYPLARPRGEGSEFESQAIFGLVGREGVGKTTLLKQFIHHRITEEGDMPERFLYLPFDADPLHQLRSDEQLRQAVRYYESRVFGRTEASTRFLILDDVHRIEHPNKPTIDGWGDPVTDLLEDDDDRHIAVTASAAVQVSRELKRVGMETDEFLVRSVLPEKFRDYIQALYPMLESEENRISPTSLREGEASLPAVLDGGDVDAFVDELRAKREKVADVVGRIQSQVVEYLAMGGVISYEQGGAVASAAHLAESDYQRLRDQLRDTLYQEVPGFEAIQTIADLERLCALAARSRGAEPFEYQALVDLFNVDRRTIADSYLSALSALYILKGVTEYDNERPREVRLYLQDPGLVTALGDGDPSAVRNDFELEAELARVGAFDHTIRFGFAMKLAGGTGENPTIRYWSGEDGDVDFVFEVDDTPVPVALAYRSRDYGPTISALQEFRAEFDAPLGLLLVGDTVDTGRPIKEVQDGIVQIPYWLYLMIC